VRLDPADIEAVARRAAELIAENQAGPQVRYVDAAQLARQLGAIRLGGARGRLRFDVQRATRALTGHRTTHPATGPARRASHRPSRRSAGIDLLPYES
jgi:hypothetical protein